MAYYNGFGTLSWGGTDSSSSPWKRPLCLIESTKDDQLEINQETLSLLQKVTNPVVVVAIVGLYRTGKSYLMNRLAGVQQGFELGSTVQSKTKGIWVWVVSHPTMENCSLVLLDTEGLGDVEKGNANHDTQIFALAVLLSSTMVYNSMGVIDQTSLEKLHFVTEITEHIKIKSKRNDDESVEFDKFFPSFIWAVRDFGLELKIDGKSISEDDYLEHALQFKPGAGKKVADYNLPRECIRTYFPQRKCFTFPTPVDDQDLLRKLESIDDSKLKTEFLTKVKTFLQYVFDSSRVKSVNGSGINGSTLGGLARCYVDAIRDGAIPCIESAVETTAKLENERAIKESIELYGKQFRAALKFPTETMLELSNCHHLYEKEAAEHFLKLCIFDSERIYYQRMMQELAVAYETLVKENETVSRQTCLSILRQLHKPIEDDFEAGKYACPGGYEAYRRTMDSLVRKYRDTPRTGVMSEEVLCEFMQQQEATSAAVLKADEKLTEEVKRAEEERQKAEASELKRRVAEEDLRKKEQMMEDQKKSFEEHARRVEKQAAEDQKKMQEECEKILEKRLREQEKLLKDGFDKKAEAMNVEISKLRRTVEDQRNSQRGGEGGGFLDLLGRFIPIIPDVIRIFTTKK